MGLIRRTQYNEVPVRVEYEATERGKGLLRVTYEMTRWIDEGE